MRLNIKKPILVFSGHVHFENFDIPQFNNVKQYVITAVNYQNTWHSKESGKDYGPGIPSYYKGKFSFNHTLQNHHMGPQIIGHKLL